MLPFHTIVVHVALSVPIYDMRHEGFNFRSDFDNLKKYDRLRDDPDNGAFGIISYYITMKGQKDGVAVKDNDYNRLYYCLDWAAVLA